MNQQITNYIRGKVLEMIVVSVATWIGFILFGLNYSLLLAVQMCIRDSYCRKRLWRD